MPTRKRSKYNNKIIYRVDGKFDSKGEYSMWLKLKRKERLGEICDLQRQVPFVLIPKSKWGRDIKYIADYCFTNSATGEYCVWDFKSDYTEQNSVFKLKSRLMAELYNIEIKIIKEK